jgi:hypothetical protein
MKDAFTLIRCWLPIQPCDRPTCEMTIGWLSVGQTRVVLMRPHTAQSSRTVKLYDLTNGTARLLRHAQFLDLDHHLSLGHNGALLWPNNDNLATPQTQALPTVAKDALWEMQVIARDMSHGRSAIAMAADLVHSALTSNVLQLGKPYTTDGGLSYRWRLIADATDTSVLAPMMAQFEKRYRQVTIALALVGNHHNSSGAAIATHPLSSITRS